MGATVKGKASELVNNKHLRLGRNVATCFVSATPYSLQTAQSQVPLRNEVHWFECEDAASTSGYYGILQYQEAARQKQTTGTVGADEQFEKIVSGLE